MSKFGCPVLNNALKVVLRVCLFSSSACYQWIVFNLRGDIFICIYVKSQDRLHFSTKAPVVNPK